MSKNVQVFGVEGMTCGHCEAGVKRAVGALAGVDKVAVDLCCKLVTVEFDGGQVDAGKIKETIEEQGFEVT